LHTAARRLSGQNKARSRIRANVHRHAAGFREGLCFTS
jgi:hypothetical protein